MKTIGMKRKRRISINLKETRVYTNHILWQKSRILIGRPRGFLPFSSPAFVVVLFFRDFGVVVIMDQIQAAVVASAKDEKLV